MSETGSSSAPIPNGEGSSRHPGNKVTVVLGAQWGDEGKGKVVDLLAQDADIVCRCQHLLVFCFQPLFISSPPSFYQSHSIQPIRKWSSPSWLGSASPPIGQLSPEPSSWAWALCLACRHFPSAVGTCVATRGFPERLSLCGIFFQRSGETSGASDALSIALLAATLSCPCTPQVPHALMGLLGTWVLAEPLWIQPQPVHAPARSESSGVRDAGSRLRGSPGRGLPPDPGQY
uniref:Uncharacterized protein n=1 Tax=Sphaerodactylus townsendi TaxID=933632 RepID=A0ACB8GB21_9SAUR